jgi:hypothetical protein
MSGRQGKIPLAARCALAATMAMAGLGLTAGMAGGAVPRINYIPTNCGTNPNYVQNCPTTAPGITYSPSSLQFGTIYDNGGSSTVSVTFTNTSGQTEVLDGGGFGERPNGDTVAGTVCSSPPANHYATLSAGQSCVVTITITIVDYLTNPGTYSISPSNAGVENEFVPVWGVIPQGTNSDYHFYVPIYAAVVRPPATGLHCAALPSGTVTGMAATADDGGYWITDQAGYVDNCGDAPYFGQVVGTAPVVGIAATPDSRGYWLVGKNGAVWAVGDAAYFGSMAGVPLNRPVVGMSSTPDGKGYWLVATDGGIFSFGDAGFYGSTGNIALNKPIVGISDDPGTGGYWMVASDGGIFAFNAPFRGSMGGSPLNKPVVGMAVDRASNGYWLVASDGGIFSFGTPFFGSTGNLVLNQPIVGMESAPSGTGYRFVAADGGIFDFGSSQFNGSAA